MNPIYSVKGFNGELQVFDNKITIIRQGVAATISVGTGEKDIFMKAITGVNIKKPTLLTRGYFQVLLQGSTEKKGPVTNIAGDENTILMRSGMENHNEFLKAKQIIEDIASRM